MAQKKLDDLSGLMRGWDGCDAEPPNETALLYARKAIDILNRLDLQPASIVSSAEGGVGICFVKNGNYSDIECLNSGEILAITKGPERNRRVWEINPDDLAQEVGVIESFLRG